MSNIDEALDVVVSLVKDTYQSLAHAGTQYTGQTYYDCLCKPSRSPLLDVLGQGDFATVLACTDSRYAVKVGLGEDGDVFGDGWLDYAAYCMQAEKMLGKPNIHGLRVLPGDGFYVALIDRYECVCGELECTDPAYERMRVFRHALHPGCGDRPKESSFVRYSHYFAAGMRIRKEFNRWRSGHGNWDLHDHNFMVAHNGRVVLTDPTSSACSKQGRIRIKEAA